MKLTNLTLFYVSQVLTSFYFWLAIAIPYLTYRGLSAAEAFSLISIYNLLGVVFEYPTGVIGDRFGYRKMLLLANFITFISMLVLASKGGYWLYFAGLTLLALGSGLLSGNDVGLLKSLSTNVKKDTAYYYSNTDFILFLSSVLAGFISRISFELALYTSAFLILVANIPMFFIKNSENDSRPESLKSIIVDSFKAFGSKKLVLLFVFTTVLGGFIFTIKSIFGSLGGIFKLDISIIGLVVGLGGLSRSIAARISSKVSQDKLTVPALAVPITLLVIALFPTPTIIIILLLVTHFLFGYMISKIDADLHELASDRIRASLFSLRRLLMRLLASVFLFFYGIAISAGDFRLIFASTATLFFVVIAITWKYLQNIHVQDKSVLAATDSGGSS